MCKYLTVGELAQRSGTTVSALHFYERQGLITPARSAGNQRRYPPFAVHLVGVIVAARAAGESIGAIRRLLQPLPGDRLPTQREWVQIVAELRSTINAQIIRLRQLHHDITEEFDRSCLDPPAPRTVRTWQ